MSCECDFCELYCDFAKRMCQRYELAEAERERLRKVLEWYADEKRYMSHVSLGSWLTTDVHVDNGQRAREALEGKS